MANVVDFHFQSLSAAARRHIRVFQIHQFLDRSAMGMTVAVVALALVDRGMDLFQISILFGVYSLTTMAMELPFGGLADHIGRKPVFLTAVVATLISLLLFLSSRDFSILALSFAFIGFGRALRSGTLDAWFVERFREEAPNVDMQPALAKAQWANAMGLAVGAVFGGLLPDLFGAIGLQVGLGVYDVSYAASFLLMIGVLIFTLLAINEENRSPRAGALQEAATSVPRILEDAILYAFKHRTVSMLLAALALLLMATNPVEVIWPTHAKPMMDEGYVNTVIGVLTAVYFFSIAIGASLSVRLNRMLTRRHAVVLCVTVSALAIVQIVLALQAGIVGFVAMFILYSVILGASETPASAIFHSCVENRHRSTILSLRSLTQQLGAALGLVLAGAIAEIYSTPIAWMAGAVFLVVALLLCAVLALRLRPTARSGS